MKQIKNYNSNYSNRKNCKQANKYSLNLGDHLYYKPLVNERERNINGITRALVNTTKEALSPYYSYLDNSIKSQKELGSFCVTFKRIHSDKKIIKLIPQKQKIKVTKGNTTLKIFDVEPKKDKKNRILFDSQDTLTEFYLSDENITFDSNIITIRNNPLIPQIDEVLEFNGKEVNYKYSEFNISEHSIITDKSKKTIPFEILSIDENGWNILIDYCSNKRRELFIDEEQLKYHTYSNEQFEKLFDGNEEIKFTKIGDDYEVENFPKSEILKNELGVKYKYKKIENEKNEEYKIQLIDDEDNDNSRPKSEYFFDDEAKSIYQGNNNGPHISYEIKKKYPEEKILILKKTRQNQWRINLNENEPIKIEINVSNLIRQKDAIRYLNNSPVKTQKNLIKLFEKKNNNLWKYNSNHLDSIEWQILNQEFDGFEAQKDFVQKAMKSNDFAILEGPPGSGKTTVILELILQLIDRGNTIILTASTHVAIDNVLEKIKILKDQGKAIKVDALRIGDRSRIDDTIREFQLDNKIEKYTELGYSEKLAKQFCIDGSNLVCGTTMGIQQYPEIKDRRKTPELPVNPKFDYMIIDEASKTTFQEFLVPAIYAKKWILAGDIKQLSPFIEQADIVNNLRITVKNDIQVAIITIFKALHGNYSKTKYAIELSKNQLNEAEKYIEYWFDQEENPYINNYIYFLEDDKIDNIDFDYLQKCDLILFDQNLWDSLKHIIPKTYFVIRKELKEDDEFLFQQNYLIKKNKYSFKYPSQYSYNRSDRTLIKDPLKINEFFLQDLKDRPWADEIAWRMIRVYERRMLGKNDYSSYEKSYELLKPISKDNSVDKIYNMALPSILESIQTGNGESNRNLTTITEGFDPIDLRSRHGKLNYQHRMHSDISKFSREHFYNNEALLDSDKTDREWEYNRYPSRSVWIDISKTRNRSLGDRIHIEEVDATMSELKEFINFSSKHKCPTGKRWTAAIITFYKPQESRLREKLREYCKQPNSLSRFQKDNVDILNYTVDKFQGREADIVFINMVRRQSIGFLDNINRLNVALTRARFQRVILGDQHFFKTQRKSEILKRLASEDIYKVKK